MNRRKVAALVIASVVASSAAGWFAGSQITSPAEAAARTAPPEPSPILVPAEDRVLSTDVVTRGTARFGSPQVLVGALTALKRDIGILSEVPLPGTQLVEGDVVATASGRPTFLLTGDQPMFRDLGPGLEGQDVAQLEESLQRLGFDPGPIDGVYDESTEVAVAEWYAESGFAPFETTEDQLAAIRAAERDLINSRLDLINARESMVTAQLALASAESTLATAAAGQGSIAGEAAARAQAEAANQAATTELAARQTALDVLTGVIPPSPATSAEIASGQAELAAAVANAESVRLIEAAAVADAQAVLAALQQDPNSTPEEIAAAEANLAAEEVQEQAANQAAAADVVAKQTTVNVLLGLIPTRPPTSTEVAAAQADLATAKMNVEATQLAGDKLIEDERVAGTRLSIDVTSANAAIQAAQSALNLGSQAVSERRALTNLISADVELARRRAGIQVPADEIIFVKTAPVRVAELAIGRGDQLTGAFMTVTDAVVLIDGSLPLEVASLVTVGMKVQIDEPDLGIEATGVVSMVAEVPGTNGVDGFHIYFETVVDNSPPNLVGASVRLTVPVESTGSSVLAVPVGALFLAVDGSSQVQRQQEGALQVVQVKPGLSAGGFVEVTPVDGTLKAGDLVLIGFEQPASVTGG